VNLGVRSSSAAHDQIFIAVEHLRSSCYGAPFLTRGRVCNLPIQFAVTLGAKSRRTQDNVLLSHLRLPQPGEPGPRIYIPQEQGCPVIPPGTGFALHSLLRLAGLWWRNSNPPPHRWSQSTQVKVKVTLRPTVSRPVRLGVRRPSGNRDKFFFLLEILFRQLRVCYFVALSLMIGRVCNLLLLLVLARAVPLQACTAYNNSARTAQKTHLPTVATVLRVWLLWLFPSNGRCLQSH
jgi:hypothetical protein